MNRLVRHAPTVHDPDLISFLEVSGTLPQSTNTRALSSGGMMRFVKNVEGAFNKMTIKMVEEDQWFEEKQQQVLFNIYYLFVLLNLLYIQFLVLNDL